MVPRPQYYLRFHPDMLADKVAVLTAAREWDDLHPPKVTKNPANMKPTRYQDRVNMYEHMKEMITNLTYSDNPTYGKVGISPLEGWNGFYVYNSDISGKFGNPWLMIFRILQVDSSFNTEEYTNEMYRHLYADEDGFLHPDPMERKAIEVVIISRRWNYYNGSDVATDMFESLPFILGPLYNAEYHISEI